MKPLTTAHAESTRARCASGTMGQTLERTRFRYTAILTASTGEEADLRAFLCDATVPIRNMPVGVETDALGNTQWKRNFSPPKLVFLGRFDVHVKGIDLLLGVAG